MCRVRRGCAEGVGGGACDGELGAHLEVGHHLCRLLVRVGRLLVSDDGQRVLVQPRVHRRRHSRHMRRIGGARGARTNHERRFVSGGGAKPEPCSY